jgi:hypothetical protein
VASWNPGAERIKGYRAAEIVGKHFRTFYPEAEKLAGKPEYELGVAAMTRRFEDDNRRIRNDVEEMLFKMERLTSTQPNQSGTCMTIHLPR